MKFLLPYVIALLLAALCAWLFGITLQDSYPDGMLIYPPEGREPPEVSDSFHIGMAMGWFFACLLLAVVAVSILGLAQWRNSMLKSLPLPLAAASLTCIALLVVSLRLAG